MLGELGGRDLDGASLFLGATTAVCLVLKLGRGALGW